MDFRGLIFSSKSLTNNLQGFFFFFLIHKQPGPAYWITFAFGARNSSLAEYSNMDSLGIKLIGHESQFFLNLSVYIIKEIQMNNSEKMEVGRYILLQSPLDFS